MESAFKGKRVLVTGAGQGIGKATATELWRAGAKVVAVSRTRANLVKLQGEYPSIDIVELDITDWERTREVIDSLGEFDALVNNAGLLIRESFLECSLKDFNKTFDLNVKAVLNVSQIVAKKMIQNNIRGAIVNVSSQASMVALMNHTIYSASKAALDALTRAMALELGRHGIRVNAVNPTATLTDRTKNIIAMSDPAKVDQMKNKIPLGRFAEVAEVVNAVLFLLSERSSMINGVNLPVDGGILVT